MTPDPVGPPGRDGVHRPRTVTPGVSAEPRQVVRPRTIGALGRPDPIVIPHLESFAAAPWQPPTGQVPVVVAEPDGDHPADPDALLWSDDLDDDLWVTDPEPAPDGTATAVATTEDATPAPRPPSRLLRNNLFVASGTAVSRLTGLLRTTLIVGLLAKSLSDAYINANTTPNIIYELILGGVLTATLVPLFTDDLEHGGKDGATSAIISFAMVALVVVTLVAAVASPGIMALLSTGSPSADRHDYVAVGIPLALLFAPQVFFYGLMALWSAVLNSRQRFLAAAWAPVLNNVIAIATLAAVWRTTTGKPTLADALHDRSLILILGIGTTAGIAVMALALYPSIRRADIGFRFNFDLKHPAVRRAVRLSGWTFGYVIANQIAGIFTTILAKPGSGGSTQYQTAFQFFQLPHGLLAVSIMVTFEPLLGRADARGDRKDFNDQLLLGFRLIGLLVIPAAIGYIALPKGLDYRTFAGTGNVQTFFDITGVVAAFAVGLPGFSSYLYSLRAFYAMKDTRLPFLINCFENLVNVVTAVAFVRWWGVVGLALSFAVAYTVAAVVSVAILTRRSPGFDWRALARTWFQLLLAAGVMGCVVFGLLVLVSPGSLPIALGTAVGAAVLGVVVYFAAIWVARIDGISELMARLPVLRRFA
ncbi:murein biosynthesis integral membrane protein MurJ [Aquihabitans sp. G128]|uniref:murein biosynthesis integral membrane protein MurJ n=1 Tax=Aquihabitans sp. G128 TaxID=2849779 RepID=UPI001C21FA6F|nr:murein biosynthesis integral membrane protein MurJ [Aquihabitans sp. G128]QXC62710.1 murein biosynthesis integral membrane protein MurJ [Aquihabitans sp. G128]